MFLGAIIFVAVWFLIALFISHYPETMAGYNTMPKAKREKIDIEKIGRLVSRVMYAGVPFALIAPLMPNEKLYALLLCGIPCGMLLVVAIYVNVKKEKFNKQ